MSVGGAILGQGLNMASQGMSYYFSSKLQRQQQEFQERMSNTQHQRAVKDLLSAGLNPVLSAKFGGNASPAGGSQNAGPGGGASSAIAMARLMQELKNLKATEKLTTAQANTIEAELPRKQIQEGFFERILGDWAPMLWGVSSSAKKLWDDTTVENFLPKNYPKKPPYFESETGQKRGGPLQKHRSPKRTPDYPTTEQMYRYYQNRR